MPPLIQFKADIRGALKGLNDLGRATERATQAALNKTADTVRSRTQTELVETMQLRKKGALKGIVVVHRATKGSGVAKVTTSDRKGLGLEERKDTIVRVSTRGTGKGGKRKVNKVIFQGNTLNGAFRIEQIGGLKRSIFSKGEGKYSTGNRRVKRLFAYPATQELIHAKIDELQERIVEERFALEFDRAMANEIRRLGL